MEDTELAGKSGENPDMEDTELAGKSEKEASTTSQEMYQGKKKEYEATEIAAREKKKELHIDESNEETFRAMIKAAYPSLSLLFLRKCLFARIVELHGRTMRDDKTIKEIDMKIGNTRQKMVAKIAFVGANEAAEFVKKEMDKLHDEQKQKADGMKGDPAVIRDKLEVLPPEWKG
ncbi:MAG: hypothetical protein MRY32_02195 [Rickettsiales bacterium]|nr:hypothetical protein [Rickettsiales bacterium]